MVKSPTTVSNNYFRFKILSVSFFCIINNNAIIFGTWILILGVFKMYDPSAYQESSFNWLQFTGSRYIVYILCMYFVYIVYLLCMYIVYIVYILCMYFVYIVYILCMYIVYIVYILCMYIAYIVYILCMYFVYNNYNNSNNRYNFSTGSYEILNWLIEKD